MIFLKKKRHDIEKTIRALYSRQFQLPLADIDVTWEGYSQWEKDPNELIKMKEIYSKTYKYLEEIIEIEDKLQEALDHKTIEKITEFIEMIKTKNSLTSMKKLNFIERILNEYPYEVDIWRSYLECVDSEVKVPSQLCKYYKRACKCCIEEIDLARKYLRILNQVSTEPSDFEGISEILKRNLRIF